MSLADVCHDQVLAIVKAREARDRDLVIKGVQELIEDLNRYAGYYEVCPPGGGIDALRRAAQRVIDHPDDEDDLLWLLALAEGVKDFTTAQSESTTGALYICGGARTTLPVAVENAGPKTG